MSNWRKSSRDITGLTGMSIIEAILGGERDPVKLAKLRDERCHSSEDQIALALQGTWRPEHLFELRQAYELYQFHHQADHRVRQPGSSGTRRVAEPGGRKDSDPQAAQAWA